AAPMRSPLPLILGSFLAMMTSSNAATSDVETAERNKAVIKIAFDSWKAGTGGPFALLSPDATWIITGNSVVAKTYASRDEFIDAVIKPFNARLRKPLVPTVRSLHADGDTVIAF